MDGSSTGEYVLYLRKSNGRKPIPRQRSLTTAHVQGTGGRIAAEFADADSTAYRRTGAARPERRDFDAMLRMLAGQPGLGVAAWHADRLTRDPEDTETLIRVCAAGRNPVETYSGGRYELWTATGRKRLRDDANAAAYEVDHNRERVLAGRAEVAQEGRWLGGKRPFGWERDPAPANPDGSPMLDDDGHPVKGILRLVPAEAAAIADGCRDVLDGITLASIKRKWTDAGLLTSQGMPWTAREVGRVLRRPRNAGLMEYQDEITGAASWPAAVDETTWRAAMVKLSDPKRKTTPGPEHKHLLSGLARCGECGMYLICTRGRGKRLVYRCRTGVEGDSGHVARDLAVLDGYVSRLVVARLSRPDAAGLLAADHAGELAALEREAAALRVLMKEANELRIEGAITKAEFAAGRRRHQEKLADVEQRTADLSRADVLTPLVRQFSEDAPDGHQGRLLVWQEQPLDIRRAVIGALMTVWVRAAPKGRPPGWRPGQPYFDPDFIEIRWRRELPGE